MSTRTSITNAVLILLANHSMLLAQAAVPPVFTGPIYERIPAQPQIDPNSQAIVKYFVRHIYLNQIGSVRVASDLTNSKNDHSEKYNFDYAVPFYYNRPTDPLYTLVCDQKWCPLQGQKIRIPDYARPEFSPGKREESDHHMAIIDAQEAVEYDLWRAGVPNGKGGEFRIGNGGKGKLGGDGLGTFGGVQAQYALTLGVIRAADLAAGLIPHALQAAIPCADNHPDFAHGVYPAAAGTDLVCPQDLKDSEMHPYFGMRIQLAKNDVEIAALKAPAYAKAIFTALAHYGAFVADSGAGGFDLRTESWLAYTALGLPDPWVALAKKTGIAPQNGNYVFPLNQISDLEQRLRIIAPCVTAQNCPQ